MSSCSTILTIVHPSPSINLPCFGVCPGPSAARPRVRTLSGRGIRGLSKLIPWTFFRPALIDLVRAGVRVRFMARRFAASASKRLRLSLGGLCDRSNSIAAGAPSLVGIPAFVAIAGEAGAIVVSVRSLTLLRATMLISE